ncbi:MAG: hypothetical protein JWO05_662 [Gemmatimonadetes bacterium]|nr:hypothetical protein [Gemmatimonadota bacterium]
MPEEPLPELARSLRSWGSARRGADNDAHGRLFAPLLEARRTAARSRGWRETVRAFDADQLGAAMRQVLVTLASERHPQRAPARRALEARLAECLVPVERALDGLRSVQAPLSAVSAPDAPPALWTEWTDALLLVYREADRCWCQVEERLASFAPPPPPRRSWWRRLLPLVLVACLPHPAVAQHRTLVVAGSADSLRRLGFDVVAERGGRAYVVADSGDRTRLARLGIQSSELRPPLRSQVAQPIYRSFDDPRRGIRAFLDSLARANPRVHVDSIGNSVEGRPILAVKIGDASESASRPNALVMGTYHAREWAATETALRLIRDLADPQDPHADSLVRNRDIWVIPVANPDGYQYTFTSDRLWRKNRRPFGTDVDGSRIYGVDLNRNHSERWGYDLFGSSAQAASEIYRGTAPASEPETQAIERFHAKYPPVVSVSLHTFAGLVLYPFGFSVGLLPADLSIFHALAGDEERPPALDHLPGSDRTAYHAGPAWNLYATNGEYTDFAYSRLGTLAFTIELTSGSSFGEYYGFEFPEDESLLQQVFRDVRPFLLDVLDAASDPRHFHSATTGYSVEPLVLESAFPAPRLRAPIGDMPRLVAGAVLPLIPDTLPGKYFRRWIAAPLATPPFSFSATSGTLRAAWQVLAEGGAEPADTAWQLRGFFVDQQGVRGRDWQSGTGTLRSPLVVVPANADTVAIAFWTRYEGNGFSSRPRAEIRVSTDGDRTFTRVATLSGYGTTWYPERVVIPGMAGKTMRVEFGSPDGLPWNLDEIAILAHGAVADAPAGAETLRASENPLRSNTAFFNWPFGESDGELLVYDFAGGLAWRTAVSGGTEHVQWNADPRLANGAYLVVARAGSRTLRYKLFIARRSK